MDGIAIKMIRRVDDITLSQAEVRATQKPQSGKGRFFLPPSPQHRIRVCTVRFPVSLKRWT
jgi:hypothetical protein